VDPVAATREDPAPGFRGLDRVPARALTAGLGTLYRARALILLVSGVAKAPTLRAMLEEPVGPGIARLAAARPPRG
jgi:glucosamine-6-phosphate deaminase